MQRIVSAMGYATLATGVLTVVNHAAWQYAMEKKVIPLAESTMDHPHKKALRESQKWSNLTSVDGWCRRDLGREASHCVVAAASVKRGLPHPYSGPYCLTDRSNLIVLMYDIWLIPTERPPTAAKGHPPAPLASLASPVPSARK